MLEGGKAMGNNGSSESKYHLVCLRCKRIIECGERVHTVMALIGTPTESGSVDCLASDEISTLCGGCASVLLSEAAISGKFVVPQPSTEATEGKVSSVNDHMKLGILLSSISDNGETESSLEVHCSQKGFYLTLQCQDGIAFAPSQFFAWKQIAQLLIDADPDMFGRLDEPLHQIFPQTLQKLGYIVPNWENTEDKLTDRVGKLDYSDLRELFETVHYDQQVPPEPPGETLDDGDEDEAYLLAEAEDIVEAMDELSGKD